jgi:hypothetical protein
MKVHVLVDKSGTVIGTFRPNQSQGQGNQAGFMPLPDQKVHEVDVPPETFAIEQGEEFHRAVEVHLKKAK